MPTPFAKRTDFREERVGTMSQKRKKKKKKKKKKKIDEEEI